MFLGDVSVFFEAYRHDTSDYIAKLRYFPAIEADGDHPSNFNLSKLVGANMYIFKVASCHAGLAFLCHSRALAFGLFLYLELPRRALLQEIHPCAGWAGGVKLIHVGRVPVGHTVLSLGLAYTPTAVLLLPRWLLLELAAEEREHDAAARGFGQVREHVVAWGEVHARTGWT